MKLFNFFLEPWLAGKADSKMRRKDYDGAIDLFLKVLKLIPDDSSGIELYYYEVGRCYQKLSDHNTAIFWFEKAYHIFRSIDEKNYSKNDVNLLISYGYSLKQNGCLQDAKQIYKEAEELRELL